MSAADHLDMETMRSSAGGGASGVALVLPALCFRRGMPVDHAERCEALFELQPQERDELINELRAARDHLRHVIGSASGAVAWLDMAIMGLSVGRWREFAERVGDNELASQS